MLVRAARARPRAKPRPPPGGVQVHWKATGEAVAPTDDDAPAVDGHKRAHVPKPRAASSDFLRAFLWTQGDDPAWVGVTDEVTSAAAAAAVA